MAVLVVLYDCETWSHLLKEELKKILTNLNAKIYKKVIMSIVL